MIQYRNKRPDQGWPALFANWIVGDSMPVVGSTAYVRRSITHYFQGVWPKPKFTLEVMTPTMTRVTRVG